MDRLEPEYRPAWDAWQAGPTPATSAALLKTVQPTLDEVVMAHAGRTDPLLQGHARRLALAALKTYDPSRAGVRTHLFNQLQGLRRIAGRQGSGVRVPERVAIDRHHLNLAEQELESELGRPATDLELADRTGFSVRRMAKVRSYRPAVAEGTLEAAHPEAQMVFGGLRGMTQAPRFTAYQQLVYEDLPPMDQKIMELAWGLGGRQPLQNQQIARSLKRSPGLISQRKKAIQAMLDQEQFLSPFGQG